MSLVSSPWKQTANEVNVDLKGFVMSQEIRLEDPSIRFLTNDDFTSM